MSKKESRRIVPASIIATVVFFLMTVFEILVLTNAIEVKASTVSRFAPWAYEPFLRLVGELPGSPAHPVVSRDSRQHKATGIELMTSLGPEALTLNIDTNAVPETNEIPDQPVETSTNIPEQEPQEVVPVG